MPVTDIVWIVAGSAASLIQGCNLQPHDIDILVKRSDDVDKIAHLFTDFLPESNQPLIFNKNWISTKEIAVYYMNGDKDKWSYARLNIHGIQIEISNTASHEYLELSPVVWEIRRYENYHGMSIPVVPLELQLHSNHEMKKLDRISKIKDVIKLKNLDLQFLENYLTDSDYRQLLNLF